MQKKKRTHKSISFMLLTGLVAAARIELLICLSTPLTVIACSSQDTLELDVYFSATPAVENQLHDRATELGMNISQYIGYLIYNDLRSGGDLEIKRGPVK